MATHMNVRIPDDLRNAVEKKAEQEERSFSDVVRRALRSYVSKDSAKESK